MKKLFSNQSGATAIEYALIAALISIVIIAGLSVVGGSLNNTFSTVGSKVGGVNL